MISYRGQSLDTNNIKEVRNFLFLIIGFILCLILLTGCMQTTNNNYRYQNNYGEECLYTPNTDSYKNLLFCYQASLSEEHSQNKLTNATVRK